MNKNKNFKVMTAGRGILILLCCFVLIAYLWYTRPSTISSFTGGGNVSSISLRNYDYDVNLAMTDEQVFSNSFDEMQPILALLQKQKYNRKIPWNKIWGIGVKANLVNLDGIQFFNIEITCSNASGDLENTSIEISSPGYILINEIPVGIGRFGRERNKLLFDELRTYKNEALTSAISESPSSSQESSLPIQIVGPQLQKLADDLHGSVYN